MPSLQGDALAHTLSFVGVPDAVRAGLTSQSWHHTVWNAASEPGSLPSELRVTGRTLTRTQLVKLHVRFGGGLKWLEIPAACLPKGDSLEDVTARFPCLEHLSVHSCEEHMFSTRAPGPESSSGPRLKSISIEGAGRLKPAHLTRLIGPRLEDFRVDGSPLFDAAICRLLLRAGAPLKRLELVRCGALDDGALKKLVASIRDSLEILDLTECCSSTMYSPLPGPLPKLAELRLERCLLSSAVINSLGDKAQGCPNLRVLKLSRVQRLEGLAVLAAARGCTLLSQIDLEGTAIDEATARNLVAILAPRKDTRLKVDECRGVPRDLRAWIRRQTDSGKKLAKSKMPPPSAELQDSMDNNSSTLDWVEEVLSGTKSIRSSSPPVCKRKRAPRTSQVARAHSRGARAKAKAKASDDDEEDGDDGEWTGEEVDESEDTDESEDSEDDVHSESEASSSSSDKDSEDSDGEVKRGKKIVNQRQQKVKPSGKGRKATKAKVPPVKRKAPRSSSSSASACSTCNGELKGLCVACKPTRARGPASKSASKKPRANAVPAREKPQFAMNCSVCQGTMRGLCLACRLPSTGQSGH